MPSKWTASGSTPATTLAGGSGIPTGLCQWSNFLTVQSDPSTAVSAANALDSYKRYSWDLLESVQGNYSPGFALIDADIATATARGGKHAIGVYCLWDQHGAKVPNYITQQSSGYYMRFAAANDTYVPDWNDPFTLSRMDALMNALGARYDGKLWFLQIGLYGDFGEWHTSTFAKTGPQGQLAISDATKRYLVDLHFKYFPNTRILTQTSDNDAAAYALAKSPAVGLIRQSLGNANFLDVDASVADSGSGNFNIHNACEMAGWVDGSGHMVNVWNDTQHTYNGAPYNATCAWDGTSSFFQITLTKGRGGQYPVQTVDVGTNNAAGNRYLHMRLKTNGVGLNTYSAQITQVGTGAAISAQVAGGAITGLTIVNGGSGYNGTLSLSFSSAGTDTGSGATATVSATNGVITSANITAGGTGYNTPPTVQILDAGVATSVALNTVGGYPTSGGWTDYNIPLWASDGTGFGLTAGSYLINTIMPAKISGLTLASHGGQALYIGECYLTNKPDGAATTPIYNNNVGLLDGAWASYGKLRWKTAPFWGEFWGTSGSGTVFDNGQSTVTLTFNNSPTSASTTFQLVVNGITTGAITYNSTPATLQSNIQAALTAALGATAAGLITVNASSATVVTFKSNAVQSISGYYTSVTAGTISGSLAAAGANTQINNYHICCVGNGNVTYSAQTSQAKSDWDNISNGLEYGTAALYSPAGYQYRFNAVNVAPSTIYAGQPFWVTSFWSNVGSAIDYEGLTATWQIMNGSAVVYSQASSVNFAGIAPESGTSSPTYTHVNDQLLLPASVTQTPLTLQLVVTNTSRPGWSLVMPNLLTLS